MAWKDIKSGSQIPSRDLNAVARMAEERVIVEGGAGITRVPGGQVISETRPVRFNARITGVSAGQYSWVESYYDADTLTWTDVSEGQSGSTSVNFAVERNGQAAANDTIVVLELDPSWAAYHFDVSSGDGLITVEEADGSPSYSNITTVRFDQADGFIVTNPSAGVARIDFTGAGTSLTVEEVDAAPSYANITTLRFDQADGFVVSQPGAGIARVDFVSAAAVIDYTFITNIVWDLDTFNFTIGGDGFFIIEAPLKIKDRIWHDYYTVDVDTLENDLDVGEGNGKPTYRLDPTGTTAVISGWVHYPDSGTGQYVELTNTDPAIPVSILHNSSLSEPQNRFWLPGLTDLTLMPFGGLIMWYDPLAFEEGDEESEEGRWKILSCCTGVAYQLDDGGGPGYITACCAERVPTQLVATLEDLGPSCSCLDGLEVDLFYGGGTTPPTLNEWSGTATACTGKVVLVRLKCVSGSWQIFASCDGTDAIDQAAFDLVACSPIHLHNEFDFTGSCCTGIAKIHITGG